MDNALHTEIRDLIDRMVRISSAGDWEGDLNPTQRAALFYLARANSFSRSPSQVADYLCTTRGTVSQTLKALARKGYIAESTSRSDRRSISYDICEKGIAVLGPGFAIDTAIQHMSDRDAESLASAMRQLITRLLEMRGNRSFGVCSSCRHHRRVPGGSCCDLLKVDLDPVETRQICYEHQAPRLW